MGMIRKAVSVSSLGLIDYYSDKERTARNTKATAKAAREQTRIMRRAAKSN